mmetsp:Transcript_71006/g.208101  ORF Transcript_71006/g.208101 Transcript_71006/m.208101 type:complete len:207 (-) Transcript_71006:144-764(-)
MILLLARSSGEREEPCGKGEASADGSASLRRVSSWARSSLASASARACSCRLHSRSAPHSWRSRCSSASWRSARLWSCASAAASSARRASLAARRAEASGPESAAAPLPDSSAEPAPPLPGSGSESRGATLSTRSRSLPSSPTTAFRPLWPLAPRSLQPGRMALSGCARFQSATRPASSTATTSRVSGSRSMPRGRPADLSSSARK